jgi:hypothetical protein
VSFFLFVRECAAVLIAVVGVGFFCSVLFCFVVLFLVFFDWFSHAKPKSQSGIES